MTGDPKVLAGLQQAFNASDIFHVKRYIGLAWEKEADSDNVVIPPIDERIRAWTPPPAEPSLEQRVAELELKLSAVNATMQEHETDLENFGNQIHELFNRTDPEPTAPDDPVCATCGHKSELHGVVGGCFPHGGCDCERFVEPTAPAPDLDPVRVEVTQENVAKALEIVGRAFHHPDTFFQYEDDRASFQFAVWVLDRIGAKFSYLKDGGA